MSPHFCRSCRRLNPPLAAYCYYDGIPLVNGTSLPRTFGSEEFPQPFFFPSGLVCRSFEELGRACRQNWGEARSLLKEGGYRTFLIGIGRADLVQAAKQAAEHPSLDLGLDDFLARLPGSPSAPPRLEVGVADIDLGTLARGQDRYFTLTIKNAGERLLSGLVRSVNCPWLGVSTLVLNEKRFQATAGEQLQIHVYVRGQQLRAGSQPQVGEVAVESNGGVHSVRVHIRVPAVPFPEGVFQGASTPRQLAEKARAAPQEMARLLENGSVARWYQCNGWTYPITGPGATGLAVVQQYFETLGLTKPTRVDLRTTVVTLQGAAGGTAHGRIVLSTKEKRPIHAHAQSDQSWLVVGPTEYRRNEAVIQVSVAEIPACAGQTLQAKLSVQANGKQRFEVPVTLQVCSPSATEVKLRGATETGFELPPLPDAPLPPLPGQTAQAPGMEPIPLAEARADSPGARPRRRLSCLCLLISLVLLLSSAALAGWKLWKANRESTPPPTTAPRSSAPSAPGEWGRVRGCLRRSSFTCRT